MGSRLLIGALGNQISKLGSRVSKSTMMSAPSPGTLALQEIAYKMNNKAFSEYETLITDQNTDDKVTTLTLNRPKRGNAFNMQQWSEMKSFFEEADKVENVRCIIMRGSNGNFSTGMDLSVFADLMSLDQGESCDGRKRESMMRVIEFFQDSISSPEVCRVPVIAAIEGNCIGAGVDLITACDMRYCTKDTVFCIKETDLAMVADVGTLQRLPHIVGDARARELAYTGRIFDGIEAEKYGLVLECFDDVETMNEHVQNISKTIASKSPLTMRGIKKTCLFTRDNTVNAGLEQVKMLNAATLMSDDLQTAFISMGSKKAPIFRRD